MKQDEPFPIQPRANAALARALRIGTVAALVCGIAGVVVAGEAGQTMSWIAVTVVIAAPLGRVGLLGIRWIQRGDHLFALLAFALLGVVGTGAALAVLM